MRSTNVRLPDVGEVWRHNTTWYLCGYLDGQLHMYRLASPGLHIADETHLSGVESQLERCGRPDGPSRATAAIYHGLGGWSFECDNYWEWFEAKTRDNVHKLQSLHRRWLDILDDHNAGGKEDLSNHLKVPLELATTDTSYKDRRVTLQREKEK